MADNTKYYYLKLRDNFFESDAVMVLESMPDGYIYENILMKLYLRSLKNGGRLMLNDRIPYSPAMLASITRHQVGTVEKAIRVFNDLGLIEIMDSGAIYMAEIQNFIGNSSTEADRIREYRQRIKNESVQELSYICHDICTDESRTDVTTNVMTNDVTNVMTNDSTIVPIIRDKDKAKDITKNKDKEREKEGGIKPQSNYNKSGFDPGIAVADVDATLKDALRDWWLYKEQRQERYVETGWSSLVAQCRRYADIYGSEAVAGIIRDSMSAMYQGIVLDRLDKRPKPKPNEIHGSSCTDGAPTAEDYERMSRVLDRITSGG